MIIDLYISTLSTPGEERFDVAYDPEPGREWYRWDILFRLSACLKPRLRIEVPDDWTRTYEHGITNLERGGRYVDPRALLVVARSKAHGCRIISGVDPFGIDVSPVEILTQPTLSQIGASA